VVCTKRYRRADRLRRRCRVRFSKRAAQLIQFVGDIIFNPRNLCAGLGYSFWVSQ
jgi:hypothetical protein